MRDGRYAIFYSHLPHTDLIEKGLFRISRAFNSRHRWRTRWLDDALTPREHEVATLLGQGISYIRSPFSRFAEWYGNLCG